MPFSPWEGAKTQAIDYRSVDQMTEQDRDVAAGAESTIGEHAGLAGLEFNQGKWSYQQVVCPAFPHHVLLLFTRNEGVGNVSMFSASIPRGGEGRVRIIPILRRGYSLWSPVPVNALTIQAFNHIRDEEHIAESSDWLGTGLCYASLAGDHPVAAMDEVNTADLKVPLAMAPEIEIPNQGGAVISFTDVSAAQRPMGWTMEFDGKGKLLKASRRASALVPATLVPEAAKGVQGVGVPQTPTDTNATPVPQ